MKYGIAHRVSILGLFILIALAIASTAHAVNWRLDVTYSDGQIIEGPLAFGLTELPDSVTASFILDGGSNSIPNFGLASVQQVSLEFGDGDWIQSELHDLNVMPQYDTNGVILGFNTLSYRFGGANVDLLPYLDSVGGDAAGDPCTSRWPTTFCRLARNSNFELNLFGLFEPTNEFVHYQYATSSQNLVRVPEPGVLGLLLVAMALMTRTRRLW